MLSNDVKSDVRRHLGFPELAVSRTGQGSPSELRNYQINETLYQLESRLEELDVLAEAKLSGDCIGLVGIIGPSPNVGDQLSFTITSDDLETPATITATAAVGDTRFNIGGKLIAAATQNDSLNAAGFRAGGVFYGQAVFDANLNVQLELKAANPFTISTAFTGLTVASIIQQGKHIYPSATVAKKLGEDVIVYGYIPILNFLESAVGGVTQNSAVSRAGEYVRGRELDERRKLYSIWRDKLWSYLGIPRTYDNSGGCGFVL